MKWLMSKCLQFQKPYKCEVLGCTKRYTDPSSLRKHVKSHSVEEQQQYRRSKDLANMAKRSCSPTARYSSWTPSSSSSAVIAARRSRKLVKWNENLLFIIISLGFSESFYGKHSAKNLYKIHLFGSLYWTIFLFLDHCGLINTGCGTS